MSEKRKPTTPELNRNAKTGRFLPHNNANPTGRNNGTKYISDLNEALKKAEKKHNKSFLEHFVDMAYENPQVAIALAKKMLPDQIEGKGFGDTHIYANLSSEQLEKMAVQRGVKIPEMIQRRINASE